MRQGSRPSRGAWIEIYLLRLLAFCLYRRAPRGARGLKYKNIYGYLSRTGRAPRGARGLKSPIQ